jgi:hypothetical protein
MRLHQDERAAIVKLERQMQALYEQRKRELIASSRPLIAPSFTSTNRNNSKVRRNLAPSATIATCVNCAAGCGCCASPPNALVQSIVRTVMNSNKPKAKKKKKTQKKKLMRKKPAHDARARNTANRTLCPLGTYRCRRKHTGAHHHDHCVIDGLRWKDLKDIYSSSMQ